MHQSQQEIYKYNLSRKHNFGGIQNPYNSCWWRNPERYAQYKNEEPNESNLTAVYISYISKKWDQNKKVNKNSPQDTEKSPG